MLEQFFPLGVVLAPTAYILLSVLALQNFKVGGGPLSSLITDAPQSAGAGARASQGLLPAVLAGLLWGFHPAG